MSQRETIRTTETHRETLSNTTEYTTTELKVQLLTQRSKCPTRGTTESAGYDLYTLEKGEILPGQRKRISTGIAVEIPRGYYGQLCSRSSLSNKFGICTLGGVIDSDYRGELFVILLNTGSIPFPYEVNDRVAQLVILPIFTGGTTVTSSLTTTARAEGGFGSTGR